MTACSLKRFHFNNKFDIISLQTLMKADVTDGSSTKWPYPRADEMKAVELRLRRCVQKVSFLYSTLDCFVTEQMLIILLQRRLHRHALPPIQEFYLCFCRQRCSHPASAAENCSLIQFRCWNSRTVVDSSSRGGSSVLARACCVYSPGYG